MKKWKSEKVRDFLGAVVVETHGRGASTDPRRRSKGNRWANLRLRRRTARPTRSAPGLRVGASGADHSHHHTGGICVFHFSTFPLFHFFPLPFVASSLRRSVAFLLAPLLLAGCTSRFHSPAPYTAGPSPTATDSAPREWVLPFPRDGDWVYERRDILRREPDLPVLYRRLTRPARIVEAELIDTPLLPIREYFRRPSMTPEEVNALPKAPLKARAALMIELDEPMPLYPARLPSDRPVVGSSVIRCYNRGGHRVAEGRIEREVTAEGLEDVTVPAGIFASCKRIRVDLRLRFPLGPTLDVTEYIWLADRLGEVRRIEHISGWFLIVPVESAYEYALVSFGAVPAADTAPAVPGAGPPAHWSRLAVLFDRVFPGPSVSGLYVELVGEVAGP